MFRQVELENIYPSLGKNPQGVLEHAVEAVL